MDVKEKTKKTRLISGHASQKDTRESCQVDREVEVSSLIWLNSSHSCASLDLFR